VPLVLRLLIAHNLQRYKSFSSNRDMQTAQQDLTLLNVLLGSGPPQPAAAPAAPSRLLMLNQLLTATSIWDDQQRQEVCLSSLANLFCLHTASRHSRLPNLHLLQLLTLPIMPACHVLSTLCFFSGLLLLPVF